MVLRAVLYLRQSLDQTGSHEAVRRQEADCRALARSNAWSVVDVFCDNDVSATARRRPAFDEMMRAVQGRQTDVIVTWHIDRLVRRLADLEPVLSVCQETGVQIATATGELDPSTDSGRLVARILSSVAQAEVERKGVRQRRANLQRAVAGHQRLVRRPFGYDLGGRVRRREANAFRFAARRVLAGESVASVARTLNGRGITSSTGTPWRSSSLTGVLRNPRYAGILTYHGDPVAEGGWRPLISIRDHSALIRTLDDPIRRARQDSNRKHLLSAIATCGICGSTVECNKDGRTGKRIYRCPRLHVSRQLLRVDEVVIRTLEDHILKLVAAPRDGGVVRTDNAEKLVMDTLKSRRSAARAQRRMLRVAEDYAAGQLTHGQMLAANEQARREAGRAQARIARTTRQTALVDLLTAAGTAHPRRAIQRTWNNLQLADRRDVIRALMTVTIERAGRGYVFQPSQVRIAFKKTRVSIPGSA